MAEDFSQAHDLAASNPEKLRQLQDLFIEEAIKYSVLPLDDRTYERFNAAIAGRPDLMGERTSLTVYPGMTHMTENAFINVKNRSHSITAEVEIPEAGGEGVILAQGGRFAGWSLYMKDGKLTYVHNWVGKARYTHRGHRAAGRGQGNNPIPSSPTMAATNLARAVPARSRSMARQWPRGESKTPHRLCSPPMKPPMSAWTRPRR